MTIRPIQEHYSRARAAPTAADFAEAGMTLQGSGGSVTKGDEFVGIHREFGIVDEVYRQKSQRMVRGRFLTQWTEVDGEVLHHTYSRALGRPVGSGEGRDARAEWRTTPERKARAQALADAAGMTLAAWLDGLVDRARK